MRLAWCNAQASHRPDLRRFRCTTSEAPFIEDDEYSEQPELPWEQEVQDYVRDLNPGYRPPLFLLLGYDDVGLGAVLFLVVRPLDHYAYVECLAVAHRLSKQGVSKEALSLVARVMEKYETREPYISDALVDPNNHAAKSAFKRAGYEFAEYTPAGYERWAGRFVARKDAEAMGLEF